MLRSRRGGLGAALNISWLEFCDSRESKRVTNNMKTISLRFITDERGQDLIEYTLLLAFVALASAALFISAGGTVNTIWSTANSRLSTAVSAAGQ
jgi:Flp pilus assembly pilin Flp